MVAESSLLEGKGGLPPSHIVRLHATQITLAFPRRILLILSSPSSWGGGEGMDGFGVNLSFLRGYVMNVYKVAL